MNEIPQSEEAERSVLGSILIESDRVLKLCATSDITAKSFYSPAHQVLFEELLAMKKGFKTIDLLLVNNWLEDKKMLHQVGGYAFLEELVDSTPTSAHAEHYIEIISDRQMRREILSQLGEASTKASAGVEPASGIISALTSSLVGLVKVRQEVTTETIMAGCEDASTGSMKNIPHPFETLTRITGGLRKGMVTVLTGRSKSGKSMYKSFWQKYLGVAGIPSLDFCFEDGIEIAKMRCASIGKFNSSEIMNGGRYIQNDGKWKWLVTNEHQLAEARHELEVLDSLPVYWHEQRMAPNNILSITSDYVSQHGIECVFIDGAKDMLRPSGKYNDCGFEEETSQTIVDMAQRLDIAVVVIHHLTKMDRDALISEGNVRGSGNIVSDCRAIYALQGDKHGAGLDKYFDERGTSSDTDDNCTTRALDCLANNHGKAGKIWLESDLGKCSFWKS